MSRSRRQFLTHSSLALLGAAAGCGGKSQKSSEPPPGAPPAFGTSPPAGPEVSPATFAEAGKLVQVELTKAELAQAARTWRANLASVYERRTGPRKAALKPELAPYSRWDPVMPGEKRGPDHDRFSFNAPDPGPLPEKDDDIAFSAVTQLSRWIEKRKLTSERLTQIYLARLEKFDPK